MLWAASPCSFVGRAWYLWAGDSPDDPRSGIILSFSFHSSLLPAIPWTVRYFRGMKPATYLTLLLSLFAFRAIAQPEIEPWGNLTGIRIDGQLMDFESSLRVIGPDGAAVFTAKEMQHPHYIREGNKQVVNTHLDSLYFTETVEEAGPGVARVKISWSAHADIRMQNATFSLELPESLSMEGTVQFVGNTSPMGLRQMPPGSNVSAPATGIKVVAPHRQLETRLDQAASIQGTILENHHARFDILLQSGDLQKSQTGEFALTITTGGDIDREPVHLTLNTGMPGRPFDGLGGNFRIQNPKLDPQVIDYCLQNLRLVWGRVELPWRFWQPAKDSDPLDSARAGHLNPMVQRAVDMARKISEKKIPLIVTAWFPPDWAAVGPIHFRPTPDHIWGNPLNHTNDEAIYKSIADYLVLLKERYHIQVSYFSFNESDLGINVRQTAQEHDDLIKGLGHYFASRGLSTKVLLGDNSDATTWSFIGPAMNDPAARPYISMISFHSWRGFDTATLQKWSDAAAQLQVPVVVGEGSIDAAAWAYPNIFQEPTYALKEISLYTRLLAICQPLSILQWQLTTDYSLLAGGGVYGDTGVLRPTQRFWNIKQLSMTPRGLLAMPIASDRPNIAVAALGNNQKHLYTVHLVNNGAAREVLLTGLPAKVKALRIYTTNQTESIKEGAPVKVFGGQAKFTLEAQSYITLIGS